MQGIPTLIDVKGLQLNASLDGDPAVSAQQLLVRDWGRFQSPSGTWEECPYRRAAPLDPPPPAGTRAPQKNRNSWDPGSMMSALVDQSIVNCFTWVLYNQGKLGRYLEGDEVSFDPSSAQVASLHFHANVSLLCCRAGQELG